LKTPQIATWSAFTCAAVVSFGYPAHAQSGSSGSADAPVSLRQLLERLPVDPNGLTADRVAETVLRESPDLKAKMEWTRRESLLFQSSPPRDSSAKPRRFKAVISATSSLHPVHHRDPWHPGPRWQTSRLLFPQRRRIDMQYRPRLTFRYPTTCCAPARLFRARKTIKLRPR